MGVGMRVVVGARTGPRSTLSTAGLAGIAAAVLPRPQLLQVVAERDQHLGRERRVIGPEVLQRLADARLVLFHATDPTPPAMLAAGPGCRSSSGPRRPGRWPAPRRRP